MIQSMEDDLEICRNALNGLLKKKFQFTRTKYIDDLVDVQTSNLDYLVSVSTDDNILILGFHEDYNYQIIELPQMIKTHEENITFIKVESKDKQFGVKFTTLNFEANYFLFSDKLSNGIAFYKTNASRNPDNNITKKRFLFKEEYIIKE